MTEVSYSLELKILKLPIFQAATTVANPGISRVNAPSRVSNAKAAAVEADMEAVEAVTEEGAAIAVSLISIFQTSITLFKLATTAGRAATFRANARIVGAAAVEEVVAATADVPVGAEVGAAITAERKDTCLVTAPRSVREAAADVVT